MYMIINSVISPIKIYTYLKYMLIVGIALFYYHM